MYDGNINHDARTDGHKKLACSISFTALSICVNYKMLQWSRMEFKQPIINIVVSQFSVASLIKNEKHYIF